MSNTNTPTPPPDMPSWEQKPKSPAPKRRRRRWLVICLAVLGLIVLLIALLPSIASMGWVRSIVVNKINQQLNGRVQISDWSLGWTHGAVVRGITIQQNDRQILELRELRTGLSVTDVVTGNYLNFGDVDVEGLDFVLIVYPDGSTNFEKLAKTTAPPSEEPVIIPAISGNFNVNFRGTIERQQADGPTQVVHIDRSSIKATVTDINQPIRHSLEINARTGTGEGGRVVVSGQAKLFDAGQFVLSRLAVNNTIELQSLDLRALGVALDPKDPINQVAGIASGQLTVRLQPGDDPTVNGRINVANLLASGPALMGDRFTRDKLSIDIPVATYVMAENRVRVGNSEKLPMAIHLDQDQITLAADARIDALANLARGAAPGSAGSVHVSTNIDLKRLADQLPNTLRLVEGIRVDSGKLTQSAAVTFTDNGGAANFELSLSELAGRDAQKKPIAIRPIRISAGGEMVIARNTTDWRNPTLSFTSGFGQISGGGPSIAQLQAKGDVRLADLRQELAPFVNLEGVELGGVAQFDLSTKGDLLRNDEPVQVAAGLALSKVVIKGLAGLPKEGIAQDELDWRIAAKVFRDAQGALQVVRDITLTGRIGPAQAPTVMLEAGGELALAKAASAADGASAQPAWTLPRWTITTLRADIGRLVRAATPFVPDLAASGYSFPAGTLTLNGEGSFTGSAATLGNLNLTVAGLVVEQTDAEKKLHRLIDGMGLTLRSAGDVRLDPKSTSVRLTELSLAETNQMFSLTKAGTNMISLVLPADSNALPVFNGRLEFAADVRPLLETVLKATGQPPLPPAKQAQPGDLLAAKINGFIEVLRAENNRNLLLADVNVTELTVAPASGPIRNEKLSLVARASTDEKLTSVDAQQVALTSAFANLVANAQVTLPGRQANAPPVSVLDIVRGANVSIDMPELQKLFAVALAFMPPSQPAAAAAPVAAGEAPAAPSQPLAVGGGSFKGALSLTRTGNSIQLRTDEWVGRGIELRRGDRKAAPLSFNLSLGGQIAVNTADASKPLLEQLQDMQITQLATRLETPDVKDMAEVALAQPIRITRSAGGFNPAGSLRIAGRLPPAMRLAEVIADLPNESLEYAGAYSFLTEMRTDGPIVTLAADGQVKNLTFGQGRERVREPLAKLAIDITLNQQSKDLTIRNLRADMEGTRALAFSVSGAVRDYEGRRTLDKVIVLLSYDAAAALKLAGPMLPADLRTLRATGVVKDTQFIFGGSYPAPAAIAPRAPTDPLAYLTAQGQLALERVEYEGLVATDIVLPVLLKDGTLRFSSPDGSARAQRPPPIRVNGGTLDLSPIEVQLAGELRLSSTATNHRLLDKVTINRQFVDKFLSSMSPFFTGAQDARGVINVQINQMQNLALGEKLSDPRGSGRARITFSINNLAIKTPFVDGLAGSGGSQLVGGLLGAAANAARMDLKFNSDGTLACAVREAVVDIDKGVVRSEMKLDIGQSTLTLNDTAIRLRDQSIVSMNMGIPRGLLPYARELPLPEVLNVPVTGTLTKFKFDIGRAIMDNTRSIIPGLGPRR